MRGLRVPGGEAEVTDDLPGFAVVPAGALPTAERTDGFRLAVVPTTVAQFWRYLTDTGLHIAPNPRLFGFPATSGTGLRRTPTGVVLDEQAADLPVTGVTWHGAVSYCDWLADRVGAPCGLPTAAEWQYAAAGPHTTRWALGDEFDRTAYAPADATGPRPVGRGGVSAFGLRDLTGNVFEWCADPLSMPGHTADLGSRVIKGGAYTVRNPESFENATVFTADELSAVPYIGFRVRLAA